ncbi:MAG TPA: hypothetical protein VGB84_00400 [Arachidicoccus sp.]
MNSKYLSIVLAVRNDNYGGDFMARLQKCISWNTALLEKYKIPTEFVLVNWNPIVENKNLEEQIEWAQNRQFVSYRIIHVPSEIHHQFVNPEERKTVPLFEFIAKNVGIRRAVSEFILITNADILFSEELICEISNTGLQADAYYRAIRCDFKKTESGKVDDIQNSIYKIFLPGGIQQYKNSGLFLKELNSLYKTDAFRLKLKNGVSKMAFKTGLGFIQKRYFRPEWLTHCNASGDFILTNKSNWFSIGGFPEDSYISTHVDSMMILNLFFSGLKEMIFPLPVYHQDHDRRFDFSEKNIDMERMYKQLQTFGKKLFATQKPSTFNADDNWGLKNVSLQEKIL